VDCAVRTAALTQLVGADAIAGLQALVSQGTSFVRCCEFWQHQPVKIRYRRILW